MPNPQKRLLLAACLCAGMATAAAAAPDKAASASPTPAKQNSAKPAGAKPAAAKAAAAKPNVNAGYKVPKKPLVAIATQKAAPKPPDMIQIAARPRVDAHPAAQQTTASAKPKATVKAKPKTTAAAPKAKAKPKTTAAAAKPHVTVRTRATARQVAAMAHQPGMGRRGAFSAGPMHSKAALMAELRNNPSLRRNLARHFHVPESRLVSYVEQNLHFESLPREKSTVVFGVSKTGKIFQVHQKLPKGTPVFCLYDKTPIMKSNCGNPIVFRLPPVPQPVVQRGPIKPPQIIEVPVRPEVVPGRPIPPGPPRTQPQTAYVPPTADVTLPPERVVTTQTDMVGTLDWIPGERHRRRHHPFPWWVAAAGIPFIFIDHGGDHHHRLVPEPTSMILFAAGGAPLLAFMRRRKRKPEEAEATETETAG